MKKPKQSSIVKKLMAHPDYNKLVQQIEEDKIKRNRKVRK